MHYSYLLSVAATAAHAHNILPRAPYVEDAPPWRLHERANFSEPCAEVAASWLAQTTKTTGSVSVPAEVALNCLHSVPVRGMSCFVGLTLTID